MRSREEYRNLAQGYDATADRIQVIRRNAIASLQLRPGESVLDIACGTGETLPILAESLDWQGLVTGVEHSPEMAAIARERVRDAHARVGEQPSDEFAIDVVVSSVEQLRIAHRYDAVLMSFTHDVLQNEQAVAAVLDHCKPGARIAVAGLSFLPWWWGAPINLFNAVRSRRYMTTFRGLREPWAPLLPRCPDIRVEKRYLVGSCYRALGTVSQ
ncbi:MAG: methyltransferase domain-containing protein [Burkholderiaceae bacterium]